MAQFEAKIKTALSNIDSLLEAYKNMITGVIIDTTFNPVFGYLNSSVGALNTRGLLAYYGEAAQKISFPGTGSTIGYVNEAEALTAAEAAFYTGTKDVYKKSSGATIVSDADYNAGKLYFAINPLEIDYTGRSLSLVNSQGVESPIQLNNLRLSEETLYFGYTRAASNGFYEADAKLSAGDIENGKLNKLVIDEQLLKDNYHSLKDAAKSRNIEQVAEFIFDLIDANPEAGPTLEAYAVKANYPGLSDNMSVRSKLELAVAAVNAPSLNLINTIPNVSKVPGYDRAMNLIDRIANKMQVKFDGVFTCPEFEKFELKELTEAQLAKFEVTFSAELSHNSDRFTVQYDESTKKWTVVSSNGSTGSFQFADNQYVKITNAVVIDGGKYIKADVQVSVKDLVQDLYGSSTTQEYVDYVNSLVDNANDIIAQLNDLETKINTKTSSSLTSVLNSINKRLCNVINNAYDYVRPELMYCDPDDHVRTLSTSMNYPTKISSDFALFFMSSLSCEYIVPFVKKHIAVVNVYERNSSGNLVQASNAAALAKAVNSNSANSNYSMNKVLDGVGNQKDRLYKRFYAESAGYKANYVYEIAYSAVDYCGYVSTRRYYITMK